MRFSVSGFFEATHEIGVRDFLLERQSAAAVVCGQAFYDHLKPLATGKPFALLRLDEVIGKPGSLTPTIANIFLCASGDQSPIRQAISTTFPQKRIFSLWSEVVPALSSSCSPLGIPEPTKVRRKLAIICAARSGSEYLCNVLADLKDLGLPREHFREFTAYLVKTKSTTGFALNDWFSTVVRCGTRDGTFSTKIIGEFLDGLDLSSPHGQETIRELLADFKFVRLRRNKVEQAVSSFIASEMRQWHVKDAAHLEDYNARKNSIAYSFGSIKWIYDRSVEAENSIDRVLEASGAHALEVDYSDLVNDIDSVVSRVQNLIGLPPRAEKPRGAGMVRTFDAKNAEFCARFSTDLGASVPAGSR
jgi:LPS sulfotransferase NodH